METPEKDPEQEAKQEKTEPRTAPKKGGTEIGRHPKVTPKSKKTFSINWEVMGLVVGMAIAIAILITAWRYSTPLQVSALLESYEMREGTVDFSTVDKYTPYSPLRALVSTKLEGDQLTLIFKRDRFAFAGMGVLCPVLFVIMFGLSGSLMEDRKFRKGLI